MIANNDYVHEPEAENPTNARMWVVGASRPLVCETDDTAAVEVKPAESFRKTFHYECLSWKRGEIDKCAPRIWERGAENNAPSGHT